MKKIIWLFLILISFACKNTKLEVPERAKGIPDNAFWVGGIDGGNWYLVESIHSHRNNAKIAVYNDYTGELIVSKKFILVCPENTQTFITDLKEQIIGYDGKMILLKSEITREIVGYNKTTANIGLHQWLNSVIL